MKFIYVANLHGEKNLKKYFNYKYVFNKEIIEFSRAFVILKGSERYEFRANKNVQLNLKCFKKIILLSVVLLI